MELKVYQQRALDAFTRWLETLSEVKNTSKNRYRGIETSRG